MALFTKAALAQISFEKSVYTRSSECLRNAAAAFSESQEYDIFLSHSYNDADEILKIKQIIEGMRFSVYVDWIQDKWLNRARVDKEHAAIIRARMARCKSLLFVTSENSPASTWMPWELGYFDGKKGKVAILPVLLEGNTDDYKGQEYLGLYPYVARGLLRDTETLWIHDSEKVYVNFSSWLAGYPPRIR